MDIVFKYFWIIMIAVTVINALIFKYKADGYIAQDPSLAKGYKDYINIFLVSANIPWIIVAIGNSTGMTNNMMEYLHPRAMNPIVLLYHFDVIISLVLLFWWVYLKNAQNLLKSTQV